MKLPVITIGTALIVAALAGIFGYMPEALIFDENTIGSVNPLRQIWQLASAHFVHISFDHLLWNLSAFGILAAIIEKHSSKLLIQSIITGCMAVSIYLLTYYDRQYYAGLSGMLNTLLISALYVLYQQEKYRKAVMWVLIGSITKTLFEWQTQSAMFTQLAWPSVPQAHLVGMITGGLLVFLNIRFRRDNPSI